LMERSINASFAGTLHERSLANPSARRPHRREDWPMRRVGAVSGSASSARTGD
jgi:hypothetical protein